MAKIKDIESQIRAAQAVAVAQSGGITATKADTVEKATKTATKQIQEDSENAKKQQQKAMAQAEEAYRQSDDYIRDIKAQARAHNQRNQPIREARQQQSELENAAQAARQQYEDYMASSAHAQALTEDSERMRQAAGVTSGDALASARVLQDDQANTLKAQADALEAQAKQAADNATMTRDIMDIYRMTAEDLQNLQRYSVATQALQNAPVELQNSPFLDLLGNPGDASDAKEAMAALSARYDSNRVRELAETLERVQNAQTAQELTAAARQSANGALGAIGHTIAARGANLLGGIAGSVGALQSAARGTGRYQTLDPNAPGYLLQSYSSAVTDQIAGNLAQSGPAGQIASTFYQAAVETVDSLARAYFLGPASLGLSAVNAFSSSLQEASQNGASPQQALTLAVANAGIETLTEKIPLDELLDTLKAGKVPLTQALFKALKQAGIEASTEELSLLGTMFSEALILRDGASYNQQIAQAVAQGMPYRDAKAQADADLWREIVNTAVVSGLSGGMSSLGGSAMGGFQQEAMDAQAAREAAQSRQAQQQAPSQPQTDAQPQQAPAPVQQTQPAQAAPAPVQGQQQTQEQSTSAQPEPIPARAQTQTAREVDPVWAQREAIEREMEGLPSSLQGELRLAQQNHDLTPQQLRELRTFMEADPVVRQFGGEASGPALMTALDQEAARIASRGPQQTQPTGYVEQSAQDLADLLPPQQPGQRTPGERQVDRAAQQTVAQETQPAVDNAGEMPYNNTNNTQGGTFNGTERTAVGDGPAERLQQYDGAGSDGYSSQRVPGTRGIGEGPYGAQSQRSGVPVDSGFVRVADYDAAMAYRDSLLDQRRQQSAQPAMGAAEADFTGKPNYNATLGQDNAQPDRRTDVRSMELPATDVNGNPVSAVTGNVYGSAITPDDFASLMEEPTASGDFSYIPISNDTATQRATESIAGAGTWERALDEWKQDVSAGKAGAELSARGALLLNYAAQQGNKQQWLDTLRYMQDLGTNTAQGLQAMRLIRSLNPPDKVEFMKATVRDMSRRLRADLQIDETLLNQYESAQTDEARDAALTAIQQNVADQIPSTLLDKWTALRYTNMLGNLKTNVRNVAGNVGAGLAYRMKDTIATGMEAIAYQVSGSKTERTKSFIVDRDLRRACAKDFQDVKATVSNGGKYGDNRGTRSQFEQDVLDKRRIFKSDNKVANALLTPLEAYRKGTNWAMNNEYFGDEAFGRAAYARAMAGYLQANGVTGSDLSAVDAALLDKARAYAVREAQEATFHDNSALANIVTGVQQKTGVIGQGIMPFTKTPANVLTRAVEFSPLGLFDTAYKSWQAAKGGGEVTGVDVINSLAKTLTGTGLFALGTLLQDRGYLTGGPDDDDEQQDFDELNGHQNYALQIGPYSFTLDWLSPVAMPLFLGAQFWDLFTDGQDLTFADMESVFTSIADPLIQMSMLQGVNDSLDSIKYTDNNLGQFAINAMLSYLTQGLTNTLFGQIERSFEGERTTTYVDQNRQLPEWLQRSLGKASQKIPGWDFQQTTYRDAWGRTQDNGGLAYNTLSPGYLGEIEDNPVTRELNRLRETTGVNVFPQYTARSFTYTDTSGTLHENYALTAEQSDTMQRSAGQASRKLVAQALNDERYQALPDNLRAKVISDIYDYTLEQAKRETLPDYYSEAGAWMNGIEGEEIETMVQRSLLSSLSSALSQTTEAFRNGWDVAEASVSQMEAVYDAYSDMDKGTRTSILDAASGDTVRYLTARDANVDSDTYLGLTEAMENIVPEEGYTNPSQRQKIDAVIDTPGITETQRETLLKLYVSDAQAQNIDDVQAMGLSTKDYAKAYDITENYTSGYGKKKRTVAYLQEVFDMDKDAATALYEIFKIG